jgi:hypothetical protein
MKTRPWYRGKAPGFFAGRITRVIVLSLLIIALAAFLLVAWRRFSSPAQTDYEGRIVDRWAQQSGEAEGYRPILALVIESSDGKRFTLRVDPNVYESARVGMRIKSRSGQIVLIDQTSSPNK